MKRLGLWVLSKFPRNYFAQVSAMFLSGIVTTPCIPSSYAKTSIMAPMTAQVSEIIGVKPHSRQALGIWFASFACTYVLGCAFLSSSAFVALMMGYMGTTFSWGSWFAATWLWYVIMAVLVFLFCKVYCRPKEKMSGNTSAINERYKALGPISKNEKIGIIIVRVALVLWLTQNVHGIDASVVALLADEAFAACGLLTTTDANAKGQWTIVIFIGGTLSISNLMSSTGCSDWIAHWLGPICVPMLRTPYLFVAVTVILTFLLRFVIVSQICFLPILMCIFLHFFLKQVWVLPVDAVIISIGTSPTPLIKSTTSGLNVTKKGGIETDPDTGKTSREGVFCGGDAATGAATVILAMGAGKTAVKSIDKYIKEKK